MSSQLHHLSIKCAIHVLHVNKFHPNCLKRRPSNEVAHVQQCYQPPTRSIFISDGASLVCTQNQFTPSEVVQWSNHRVMEWLRSVDLAEYAPNLRGSGVHGGLIVSARFDTAAAQIHTRRESAMVTVMAAESEEKKIKRR